LTRFVTNDNVHVASENYLKCEEERQYVNESNKKNYLVMGSGMQLSAVLCFKSHIGISGFTSDAMGSSGMSSLTRWDTVRRADLQGNLNSNVYQF
jgi:hypothetical protein